MAPGRRGGVVADVERLLADDAVDLREHLGEGVLHVHRLQGRRLHEEGVLALGEGLGVLGRDGPEVAQVRLVPYQHHDDVGVRVVPQLPHPPLHVLEGDVPRDVVHDQRPYRSAVVRARDSAVSGVGEAEASSTPSGKLAAVRELVGTAQNHMNNNATPIQ
uniref:Uncharacterized protein n=1 Tax=Zea mays TaxID=4577 RepID=C0PBZ2_MAIZE|nr:unknown [Zea mays]